MKITTIVREKLKIDNPPILTGKYKDASVFLLITEEKEPKIFFILRSKFITSHAGEIGFPGGIMEKYDRSLIDTAYRETYEEINISKNDINFIGRLGHQLTLSGIRVTPYVGTVQPTVKPKIKSLEIAEIMQMPLGALLVQSYNNNDPITVSGERTIKNYFTFGKHVIWGLTGRVLCDFFNQCFDKKYGFSRDHEEP